LGVAVALTVLFLAVTAGFAQQTRIFPGHVPDVVGRLQSLSDVDGQTSMKLSVGLPLRHKEALTNLMVDLYNPASPQFHQYLTPAQFADQFGPTKEDHQKVVDYLASHGLKVDSANPNPNRMVVDVVGAAADVERAFNVHLRVYRHPTEQRNFFAPDANPSVGGDVPVLDVMGLDNYIVPHPIDLRRGMTNTPNGTGITNYAEEGSGPGGSYIGNDFRAAYVPGVTNTGVGQYIGLVEFGPYWTNDIYVYETNAHLSTNIVISNIFLNGVTEPPAAGTDAGEQAIDIEMCISMAPGATVLYYGGESVDTIYGRIASDNLAKQISCSFGFGIDATTEQLYQEFVTQGQNFFQASGDGGAQVGIINPPACEPYITLVGGTDLYTASPGGVWTNEYAWADSSGGVSTFYAIPDYQQGINMAPLYGSGTMRNFPDVAMMADFFMFVAANNTTSAGGIGGTSFASPEYAGFYALANQQAATLGRPPLGFFNPALYAIGKSTNYTNCFHDITIGNTVNSSSGPNKFFAAVGYDLATGWGSPNGSNLINALTGIGSNNFFLYAAPVALNLTVGGSETVLVTVQPMNVSSETASLSVSGLPTGVTASFSAASSSTTSILTLTAGSTAVAGTSTVTLTGVSGGITQTAALTVTIVAATPGTSRVSLSSAFNRAAFYTDGTTFSGSGGANGGGGAYSANLLGSALNWAGCLFTMGAANANDTVDCSGQTITLPSGQFSSLQMLASAVDGTQTAQQFIVTYTDGTTSSFIQSLSDWTAPSSYLGETIVIATTYENTSGGTKNTVSGANVYGYSFGLNNTKTVKSIKLPDNGNVLIFAMTLANDFSLYGSPASVVLTAGGKSACYLVSGPVTTNGFSGSVSLSTTGLPAGVTGVFNAGTSSTSSNLTLTAGATAQPVNTYFTLASTFQGLTHYMTVNLSVMTPIPGAAPVSLGASFNQGGIFNDGATFSATGGFDGAGNGYSANLLTSAANWNGCLFTLGAAAGNDAVRCAGQTITLPAGQYTGLMLLGAAIHTSEPNQTFKVNYTDGTSATVTQGISPWTAAQNYAGESVAISTAYSDTSGGTENTGAPVNLYGYVLPLSDSKTVQSITLPNNSDVAVLAMTLANAPTAVSLASPFNRIGIYGDGTVDSAGGLDGGGYAYSSNQLGSSLIWDSVQFKFGAANVDNVVNCSGQTITLPANRYTSLLMLATGVEGAQTSQRFTVTYTDGTTTPIVQSLSDWVDVTTYTNQFTAVTMPYRLTSSGSADESGTRLFGYLFPLNNTKTVQSLTLPNNTDVDVLAVTLANTPVAVSLQTNFNRAGIFTDGTAFTTPGLDGDGNAYSATLLGPTEDWHNSFFEYGLANQTNAISASSQTILLPQGQYSALLMLATAVNGGQTSQHFTVNYTNGTSNTFSQSVSDWASSSGYSGESIVVAMGYRDSGGGGEVGPAVNLYGYSFALNSNNVVQSLTLPNNANVEVLAVTLSNYTSVVPEAPGIATQPQSLAVTNGTPAAFTVTATGTPTLSYQWRKNGTALANGGNITGATTSNLSLTTTSTNDAAGYAVVVTNAYGAITSSVATLTVNPATPGFSNLTASQAITYGTNGMILAGRLNAAGPVYPASGETIGVTIDGNLQTTTINDSTGDFSFSYNPQNIPVSGTAYTITYSYGGDASLNPASNASTALTVNKATPAFFNLTASKSITTGTSTVNLAGTVSAVGPVYPASGETVGVTINGNSQPATISDATGDFSINYNSSAIPASGTPYIITYSYAGDASLNPASNGSTTLTVSGSTIQSQFVFITNAGAITIVAYTGLGGAVFIPPTITGLPVTSIGEYAFNDSTNLTSVTIPVGITNLGDFSFNGCTSLTGVIIPDSMISLGNFSFYDCTSLTNVTIPASVTSIGAGAFTGCSSLTAITVEPENSVYSSVNGVLFDAIQSTLLEYPGGAGGTYTVPASVSSIGLEAFEDCSNLTSVTIPAGVTSFGSGAFENCPGLTGVYFEGNAPGTDSSVFADDNIATAYYLPGTTGWNNIFAGIPTALWFLPNPLILGSGPGFGVQSNGFGFIISWSANVPVVVEASTNLANPVWEPLQTNALTNGSFQFTDPQWSNYPTRFYRIMQQ
jgi:hypothetical protein